MMRASDCFEYAMLALLFLALCLQNLILIDFEGFAFKFSHALFLFFALYVVDLVIRRGQKFRLVNWRVNTLFAIVFLSSIIAFPRYGISPLIAKYAFMYALVVFVYNYARLLHAESLVKTLRVVCVIVLVSVVVKDVFYIDSFRVMLESRAGHPVMPYVFGGGPNLEASWLAMFAVLFGKDIKGACYLAMTTLLSIAYQSRAGLIACFLAFVFIFAIKGNNGLDAIKNLGVSALLLLVFAVICLALDAPIIRRFVSIGSEPGSLGRLSMWEYVPDALESLPVFGYGAGGSMGAIEAVSGYDFMEGNVHNYYIQVLLDFGPIGFLFFIAVIFRFLRCFYLCSFSDSFSAFIVSYLILAMIQFGGGDALMGLILACHLAGQDDHRGAIGFPSERGVVQSLSRIYSFRLYP